MAITVQHLGPSGTPFYSQQGRWNECICDLLLDSSYPANGYAMSNTNYAGQFNMGSILHMEIGSVNGPTSSGIFGQWAANFQARLF